MCLACFNVQIRLMYYTSLLDCSGFFKSYLGYKVQSDARTTLTNVWHTMGFFSEFKSNYSTVALLQNLSTQKMNPPNKTAKK